MPGTEAHSFTLALGQILVVGGAVRENLARAADLVGRAAAAGARLVLLPEALDCGWCDQSALREAEPVPGGSAFEFLAACAAEHRVHLCAGLVERDGPILHNTAVLLGPDGGLLLTHRKVNELDLARDLYAVQPGPPAVQDTELGRLGLLICADAFLPGESLTRSLAASGAQLILSPCAWAVPPDHDQEREPYGSLWRDVYGRVARDCGVWIAGCSNVGTIRHGAWRGHLCIGSSLLINPHGDVQAAGAYGPDAAQLILHSVTLPAPRSGSSAARA